MAARFPFYLLADSPEGRKKNLECGNSLPLSLPSSALDDAENESKKSGDESPQSKRGQTNLECGDSSPLSLPSSAVGDGKNKDKESGNELPHSKEGEIKRGFVYKRVPHVTLKSIANNPDIKEGMTRAQIDAAIAKHADTELLFDKPYEDNSKVRVTGPFTVESLSPHRRLTVEAKKERAAGQDGFSLRSYGPDQFGHMILDNLRKSGVQAREKNERLKFDSLEPFPGEWIHATGEFTDSTGAFKRVAVCIGPEHGTVGPELVKEAAKEVVKGRGFDLLYVLGFAFDPHVDLETKNFGKLNVQICRMNPDLSMGDELLKKTGAGNLFMVFGEPDIEILECDDSSSLSLSSAGGKSAAKGKGKGRESGDESPQSIRVTINGVDVYDPTTGEIRSRSTDDIACWFIDTSYDGESFFVRHAYFTGAQEPYDKLKRALRADIDEAAWSALYSTTSQPFAKPAKGKIAVKVINHYGDEVLKVYSV